MPVRSPLPNDTRSVLADWLELTTLTRPHGVATRSDVLSLFDQLAEDGHDVTLDVVTGEELEVEILEDARSQSADEAR